MTEKPQLGQILQDLAEKAPSWARYIAIDGDGAAWAYSVEPHQNTRGWYENEWGDYEKIAQLEARADWQQALLTL